MNNFRRVLACFFDHAKRRKYLPRDWDEMAGIESVSKRAGAPEIYTPEEIAKLIKFASKAQLPFIVIGAFAGLRSAEIARLDWSAINFKTGFIELKAVHTKTGSRRLVPITENLREWLKPIAKESGPVCPGYSGSFYRELRNMARDEAKVPLRANALRHSFCSYRLAVVQSANQIALECGNSAAMVFAHYRELVRPDEAKAWFAVRPKRVRPEAKRKAKMFTLAEAA